MNVNELDLSRRRDEIIEEEEEYKPTRRRMTPALKFQYFIVRSVVKGLQFAFGTMPERLAYRSGSAFMMFLYRALPSFRKLAFDNLKTAFGGEKSDGELRDLLKRTYLNYGKNLVEFFLMNRRDAAWIEGKVRFNDPDFHIRTALQKGRGVIGLAAHFGSWELVNARCAIYKYPVAVVVRAQRDALITDLLMNARKSWGNEYIFRAKGVKAACLQQLKQGKILGLVADQNAGRRGIFVDFFGKPASTFRGPAEIARESGAPIVPAFPARNEDGTITLHVYPPLELRRTDDVEGDLIHNTKLCQKAIEDFCREHPAEYFWWHRRWKTRPKGEAGSPPGK